LLITYTLGFKPGGTMMYLRNVIDVAHLGLDIDKIINVIKKLGRGGLMFFSLDKSELQNIILQKLNEIGIKAAIGDPDTIKDFATGKYDVLLGVAYHYGKLVRGIDLPEIVKYAIFVGIPKFRFRIGEVMHPIALVRLLSLFARYDQNAKMLAGRLRRRVLNLSPAALEEIYEKAKEGKLEDEEFVKAYQLIQQLLQREDLKAKLNENSDFVIEDNNITTPDYITYLQASGRTSRLLKNKITLGLSIVFAENQKLLEILEQRLAYIVEDIKFKELNNTATKIGKESLEQIKAKLEKDRETIGKSKAPPEIKSVLMIVESPYKAKTISRFFSKPSIRIKGNLVVYEISLGNTILQITSTQGHLFDLTTKPIGLYGIDPNTFTSYYDTIKRCENGHQFVDGNKCPKCGANIILDKTNFVEALRELALENDEIIIGSDPDVEGERIAWDIYLNIRPFNSNIKRGEFHEVTKHAILEAINNPRNLNINLLYSQLVRRI
jgi:reverse gyrase